jgi:hypothetical protein
MLFPCPTCRAAVFTVWQKDWASAFKPLKCSACGALAGPSWWTGLVLTSLPFVVIFSLWFSLVQRAWWPIVLALIATAPSAYAVIRYFPLARISFREVVIWRVLGLLLGGYLLASVILSMLGYRVGL